MFRRLIFSLVLFGAASVAFPVTASAQLRVALLDVEGSRDGELQEKLEQTIKEAGHRLIKSKVYRKSAKRIRATKFNATDVQKVADYIEIDVVILGTLTPENGKYLLRLRIREGKTGRLVTTLKVKLKKPVVSDAVAKKIRSRLIRYLDEVDPVSEGADDDVEVIDENTPTKGKGKVKRRPRPVEDDDQEEDLDDEPRQPAKFVTKGSGVGKGKGKTKTKTQGKTKSQGKAKTQGKTKSQGKAKTSKAAGRKSRASRSNAADEDEEEDVEDEEIDDSEDDDVGVSKSLSAAQLADREARSVPLRIFAGMSMNRRAMTFNQAVELNAEQAPQDYNGNFLPAAYIAGEVYPMAFLGSSSFVRDIGIGFGFERVLSVNANVEDNGQDIALPATQMTWAADLRYRYHIGSSPTLPTVVVSAGFGQTTFEVERGDTPIEVLDLPNTSYTYINPGVGLRWPYGQFAGVVTAAFPLIVAAGEVTQQDYYGTGRVLGYDVNAMVEYRVLDNLLVSAGARLLAFGHKYNGDGDLSSGLDGDNDTVDIDGAMDMSIAPYIGAGFLY